jgi:hypothetical protein
MDTFVEDNYKTEILLDTEHGKRWYRDIRVRSCDCGSTVAEVFDSIYYFEQDGSKHNCDKVTLMATNQIDEMYAVRLSDRSEHE